MREKPVILVVDDTESNIDMLNAILKQFDVIPALGGEDAIEMAKCELPDLILLDILMPDIDGFEVCKTLKKEAATATIPIIFLTAKADEESIEKGYALGGVDFVTKPFKPRELLAKVKTYLELRRYQHELEAKVQEEIQKRLEQEKAMLQSAKLAEMGEMVAAIAHQWKQPLSALHIMIDEIKELSSENRLTGEILDSSIVGLKNQIRHMGQTVDTFKNFLKPSALKERFDVTESIKSVLELLKPLLRTTFVGVSLHGEDKEIFIEGYKNELRHVFLNIIKNSIEAISAKHKSDGGKIEISIKKEEHGARVVFSDNGSGINEELLPNKIFEQYITTKGEYGTGIGLNVCKVIVIDRFGGEISAKNTLAGAEFSIFLPIS